MKIQTLEGKGYEAQYNANQAEGTLHGMRGITIKTTDNGLEFQHQNDIVSVVVGRDKCELDTSYSHDHEFNLLVGKMVTDLKASTINVIRTLFG